jgi:N-methylhydantoinase B
MPSFLCANVAETIFELINRAIYKILPERIPACSGGDVIGDGFFGVDPRTGKYWSTIAPSIIGHGADHASDGDSYLMFHSAGASQNIPTEILESTFPLFVEKVELIPDSGGAGKHRGGLGSLIRRPPAFTASSKREKARIGASMEGKTVSGIMRLYNHGAKEHSKS